MSNEHLGQPAYDSPTNGAAQPSWKELAAQLRATDPPPAPGESALNTSDVEALAGATHSSARVVVATDWSSATIPLAVLRGFAAIIPAAAPVDLVFAVPHTPSTTDVECVHALLEGLDSETEMAGVLVESFDEVSAKPCRAAVIPTGDEDAVVMQLTDTLIELHKLVALAITGSDETLEPHRVSRSDFFPRLDGFVGQRAAIRTDAAEAEFAAGLPSAN